MKITKEQKIFVPLALVVSVVSIIGFDVYARLSIRSETLIHALSKSLYYSGIQIVGTVWLIAPFLIVALIAATAAKNDKMDRGWCFLICGVLLLMRIYLKGYISSHQLLEQKKWTAATLAIGFMPLSSVPILIILGVILIALKVADRVNI